MLEKTRRWLAAHPNWALTLVTVAVLAPFLAKPFNIDEPLFLWTANQIQAHPGNPYGFAVNWYGTALPMWEDLWDTPLMCYYLAGAAAVLGRSEVALHAACLLPALALILGTCRLARHFCHRPMLAALATLLTPVVLISSTTVMCDVLMVAFWVWAVVLWMEGMERDSFWRLASSSLLVSLAIMTKQFGVSLIPLLAVYSVFHSKRQSGRWAFCLLLPLATLVIYEWMTGALYGQGLFFNAGSHATASREYSGYSVLTTCLTALTFTGGCLAVAIFFAPLIWRARVLAAFAICTILPASVLFMAGAFFKHYNLIQADSLPTVEVQIVLWAIGGMSVLALAVASTWRGRDSNSWLLFLWVAGTFAFAAFFNWTVNGRSILPMAPAVAILLVRRLEQSSVQKRPGTIWVCLSASAMLALWITRADWLFARANRESAQQTHSRYALGRETLWFQGHWGFQFYLENLGASSLDLASSPLKIGDFLAIPSENTNITAPKSDSVKLEEILTVPKGGILATMDEAMGASFYAATRGPLPFAFGPVPPERVMVFSLTNLTPASAVNKPSPQ
jgi:4-amino-4-deoxy-L-arabinose transferase-like glycosyltransferase